MVWLGYQIRPHRLSHEGPYAVVLGTFPLGADIQTLSGTRMRSVEFPMDLPALHGLRGVERTGLHISEMPTTRPCGRAGSTLRRSEDLALAHPISCPQGSLRNSCAQIETARAPRTEATTRDLFGMQSWGRLASEETVRGGVPLASTGVGPGSPKLVAGSVVTKFSAGASPQ